MAMRQQPKNGDNPPSISADGPGPCGVRPFVNELQSEADDKDCKLKEIKTELCTTYGSNDFVTSNTHISSSSGVGYDLARKDGSRMFWNVNLSETKTASNSFLKLLEKPSCSVILMEGAAGTGKTTIVRQATHEWAKGRLLKEYKLVLLVNMRQVNIEKNKYEKMEEIVSLVCLSEDKEITLHSALNHAGKEALIILDGFDELNLSSDETKEKFDKSIFPKILSKTLLPEATVLVTTRPIGTHTVHEMAQVTHHVELLGFERESAKELLLSSLSEPANEKLSEHIKQHPPLEELCVVPVYWVAFKQMYTSVARRSTFPSTLTEVLLKLVVASISHALKVVGVVVNHLSELPEEYLANFQKVCQLALTDITQKLSEGEMNTLACSHYVLNVGHVSLENLNDFGLFEPKFLDNARHYLFLHMSLQEFLAAYALQQMPPVNQIHFLYCHVKELVVEHENLFLCYFGETALETMQSSNSSVNPTKLSLPSALQLLACLKSKTADPEVKRVELKDVIFVSSLIYEAQELSLWRKLLKMDNRLLEILLGERELQSHETEAIVDMVLHSSIKVWKIHAPDSLTHFADELKSAIEAKDRREQVKVEIQHGSNFTLTPSLKSSSRRSSSHDNSCSDSAHTLSVKSLRSIFHRSLQLSSPTQLRSDGNNPAFISFLCCQHLQEEFNKFYEVKPIHSIHWLPGPKLAPNAVDRSHFIEQHDGKQLELVVMVTPYPTLLRFVVNGTDEEVSIVLSKDIEPTCMDGEIAKSLEKVINEGTLVQCVEEVNTADSHGQIVLPSFPLPERQQEHGSDSAQSPRDEGALDTTQMAVHTHDRSPTNQPRPLIHDDVAITPSHFYYGATPQNNPEGHFQQHTLSPVATQAQSSHRQEAMRPGTVLFTSMPREIPSDHIQPLPDESQLIKRGGNGSIYAGTISGMTVAIKKTHYRSKEFSIMSKIRHRNIMPLLAFVLGEENLKSRRRYYCYHVMPRLTGDLARLLTDKEEFTLKNLRRKHRNNPRLLGLMQGNLKFIVREVLCGLSYLHALHIAHRDIKGSNILVKFYCSCDIPLDCACDSKYQVVITDFDAAVELDSDDHLPPTSASTHSRLPQYHCVPVGTNGYRAPECSMMVVTNSNSSFSPPVSTKCDLWSLGVLVCRMLIGMEGPSSQIEMAILLLRYHQMTGRPEGISRFNIAHVDDRTLEKVLQISHLRREVRWLRNAGSFVQSALELDPVRRLSAEELLQHGFLH